MANSRVRNEIPTKKDYALDDILGLNRPLRIGSRIRDVTGLEGVVVDIIDQHNILVKYDGGGDGLYCQCPVCSEWEVLEVL